MDPKVPTPLDTLDGVSRQSRLIIDRYHYFEDGDAVVDLGIPAIDKEIASVALICLAKGRSAGILYPFPESDYSILPLLGPLAHLLVGRRGYYVLASRSCDWKEAYRRITQSSSRQRQDQLRSLHPYGTVGMNGRIVSFATARDSTRKVNIIFSRASSSTPLVWDEDIRGIVIDVGPPRARLAVRRVVDLYELANSHNVPCVTLFGNANSAIRRYLEENGVSIFTWQARERSGDTAESVSVADSAMAQDSFVGSYMGWSRKIHTSCGKPQLEVFEIGASDDLSENLRELNARLESVMSSFGQTTPNQKEESLVAYASFLESRVRTMWTTKSDFNRAAIESYCGETIEASCDRLVRSCHDLYSSNATLATEAIRFSDQYRRVSALLDSGNTAKSRFLEHAVRHEWKESSRHLLNYGRIPQKACNILLERCGSDGTLVRSSSAHNLSSMPDSADVILPGYPLYSNCNMLFTASARRLTVLCYPWEILSLRRRIGVLDRSIAAWQSNTENLLRGIAHGPSYDAGSRYRAPPSEPALTSVEAPSHGHRCVGQGTSISQRDLADFLELGERPESVVMVRSSDQEHQYVDSGSGPSWMISTDQGSLLVREDRKLTVVYHTYSEACLPSQISIGDVVMVGKDFNPRPMSDYVWDIMAMKGLTKEGAIWREWKRQLRNYVDSRPGEDSRTVFDSLRELGMCEIETPQAVYAWLNSDDLIGPQSKNTIMCLGRLLGASETECELWWASIRQVRSTLMSAYSHLWKLARYHASHLASGDNEDVVISPELEIWLSDLAELVTFARVISQPQYIQLKG